MHPYRQKAIALRKLCDWGNISQGTIPAGADLVCKYITDKPVMSIWSNRPEVMATVVYIGKQYEVPRYDIRIVPQKGIALEELADENWKTQTALGYPNVPKGAEVKVLNTNFKNLYGEFFEIEWNEHKYYVRPNCVKTELN